MHTIAITFLATFGLSLAMLTVPVRASAKADPDAKCHAQKLKAAGKAAKCRSSAAAKAVKKQQSADFSKCGPKLTTSFGKAETKAEGACVTSGDAGLVSGELETCSDALFDDLGGVPGPGTGLKCEAAKLKAVGKMYLCVNKAEGKAVLKGLLPFVDKCVSKFEAAFAKAEATSADCVTGGDAAAVDTTIRECSLEGFELMADFPEFPIFIDDYTPGPASFVDVMTIPEVVDGVPACCRDFGAISKDFLVGGTNELDNALAVLGDQLNTGTGGLIDLVTLQQMAVEDEDLVFLFDHQALDTDLLPDVFTLMPIFGSYTGGTTFADAAAGAGQFLAERENFVGTTGEPSYFSFPTSMSATDMASISPFELPIKLVFGVFTLDAVATAADVTASHGAFAESGISYTSGQMSGYVVVDDVFNDFNAVLNSPTCDCLGLTEDVYTQDPVTSEWTAACIVNANELCTEPTQNGICISLADPDLLPGVGTLSGVCAVISTLLQGAADIDLDGDPAPPAGTGRYEALSFGMAFEAEPATIIGLEP